MKPVSNLLSAALLLTVLMTACGGGSSTPPVPVPSSDTFKPYSAVTDARSGAFLLQADGSYTIPVRGTLETSGARGSGGSKKDGQVMGSNLPTHMGAD